MGLPGELAGLVEDLEKLGYQIVDSTDAPWPGGPSVRLHHRGESGVQQVRLSVDRGIYEVMIQVAGEWYEPYWALRALDGEPDQSRALSYAERRASTLDAVQCVTGRKTK